MKQQNNYSISISEMIQNLYNSPVYLTSYEYVKKLDFLYDLYRKIISSNTITNFQQSKNQTKKNNVNDISSEFYNGFSIDIRFC